jgi:hypothetical protein
MPVPVTSTDFPTYAADLHNKVQAITLCRTRSDPAKASPKSLKHVKVSRQKGRADGFGASTRQNRPQNVLLSPATTTILSNDQHQNAFHPARTVSHKRPPHASNKAPHPSIIQWRCSRQDRMWKSDWAQLRPV